MPSSAKNLRVDVCDFSFWLKFTTFHVVTSHCYCNTGCGWRCVGGLSRGYVGCLHFLLPLELDCADSDGPLTPGLGVRQVGGPELSVACFLNLLCPQDEG